MTEAVLVNEGGLTMSLGICLAGVWLGFPVIKKIGILVCG